jgi:hypothetical protein
MYPRPELSATTWLQPHPRTLMFITDQGSVCRGVTNLCSPSGDIITQSQGRNRDQYRDQYHGTAPVPQSPMHQPNIPSKQSNGETQTQTNKPNHFPASSSSLRPPINVVIRNGQPRHLNNFLGENTRVTNPRPLKMRTSTLLSIFTAAISGVTAIDKISRQASTCISYAVTNNTWTEDNLRRRRVVYDTTKNLVQYDHVMYSVGWMWSNEKEGTHAVIPSRCLSTKKNHDEGDEIRLKDCCAN